MAGLPANRATVWVGPPLLARTPRPALLMPTRFPWTPLVSPPAPPVPIRLKELAGSTLLPKMSLAAVLGASPPQLAVLVARVELFSVRMPSLEMAPPSEPQVLALRVLALMVMVPELEMAPPDPARAPEPGAVLPVKVQPVMVTAPVLKLNRAPPAV